MRTVKLTKDLVEGYSYLELARRARRAELVRVRAVRTPTPSRR